MNESQTSATASGSPQFTTFETLSESDERELQRAVLEVADHKNDWANWDLPGRIRLLDSLIVTLKSAAAGWVSAACQAKRLSPGTPPAGEEWLGGPFVVARNIRLLRNSLSDIARTGKPSLLKRPFVRNDGQVVAPVFPTNVFDKLMYAGFQAEIWMEPSVTLAELPATMAVAYDNRQSTAGSVCLVLGAGNVASIGPMDALYKMFVENQVVVLKMNPVNDYLFDHFNLAFRPLIQPGFLRFVRGGAAAGKFLCEHPSVDQIHITGSDKTHDAIVYGSGPDGANRKVKRDRICQKQVTSELGNVSPVIVVPGKWSPSDIALQAENVASMLVNNAGFNCNSIRVLITHDQWPQRDEFLTALRTTLKKIPSRFAYYPGAKDRFDEFTNGRPNIAIVDNNHQTSDGRLPWTMVENLDATNSQDICFNSEAFCGLMGETQLPGKTVADYLQTAVKFANDDVWGTLNASMIVHPQTLRSNPAVTTAFDQAIADLKFGTVAINHWAGINFGLCSTTWGAFPGSPPEDIQSGSGVVHNTYMFDRAQKTVLRGPFRPFPKPAWFANHTKTHQLAPALFEFECLPSWLKLPGIFIKALG